MPPKIFDPVLRQLKEMTDERDRYKAMWENAFSAMKEAQIGLASTRASLEIALVDLDSERTARGRLKRDYALRVEERDEANAELRARAEHPVRCAWGWDDGRDGIFSSVDSHQCTRRHGHGGDHVCACDAEHCQLARPA